ncbi:AMP-dependent synthetase/ligase [Criblamydia sequanensis]|uniref:Long-chain-fatty-acid--CoA ligase n=1 Tax=Candidatus Criblamydia sequanensis CRIB-18 TaxID=1437425 RepID=A0A090D106_9BACT|nr:long-chain fatty acid--CoA ligase [Criblamydia sequanensis]CDR33590.1 Long-chain-fatty-acid--CoA ligase [Criblamydia sequanensis CRIB-18]
MDPIHSIAEAYKYVREHHDNPKALAMQTDTGWDVMSTKEVLDEIKYMTLGIKKLGIKKGDMVGILANSSPRWSIVDVAIMLAGAVSVPLFANISNENFIFEVEQTGLRTLFISGKEPWEMYGNHKESFESVVTLYDEEGQGGTLRYNEILEQGKALDQQNPDLFEKVLNEVKPDDLATIVYTSGSTGIPKGVMLTHFNLIGLGHIDPFSWDKEKDLYLSILPLAHIFGRSLNFCMMLWGVSVYYIKDIKTVGNVCREIHPTIIVLVPRLLEKIYAKMLANVQGAGFLKRALGQWAFDLANNEKDESLYKQLLHPLADKIVYSALREALGGNLRVIISGGAALNPHLYHFFKDIGLPLYEGWGLTEASTVGANLPGKVKIGTVGPAFPGIKIKISDEGEILVKGPIVMKGYYKNKEATDRALDSDGWLHTGDKGKLDEDGYLTIIGRMKELYKMSTGKFIAPVPIEQKLMKAPLIDMAMVVAEGRNFASCLLFPDLDVLHSLKKANQMENKTDEEFVQSDFVKKEMDNLIEELNKHLNHWEEIHRYSFVLTHLTIEGGELTPTMKIRREVVSQKYRDLIEGMYEAKEVEAGE